MLRRLLPVLCVFASFSLCPAWAGVQSFTLRVGATTGFQRVADGYVPLQEAYSLAGGQAITLEAEAAHETMWQPGGAVQREGDVTFAGKSRRLRFYYQAAEKGTVYVWARIRQGEKSAALWTQGHVWSSDTEAKAAGKTPAAFNKEVAGKWRWTQLRAMGVNAGPGFLQLVHTWPGAPDLDKIVLSFANESPEGKEIPAPRVAVTTFAVESDDFKLPAATKLVSAAAQGDAILGTLEATLDNGKTWQPAANLALTGTFRLRFTPPAGWAAPPKVKAFQAQVDVDPQQYLLAGNKQCQVGIDTVTPGIFRVESPALGKTIAAPAAALPLFALELKQRGKPWPTPRYILQPKDGKLLAAEAVATGGSKASQGVALRYAFLDGTLTATATFMFDANPESLWTLTLDNKSAWDVLTYTFPRVAGLQIGDTGYDDTWVNTNIYGPWMGDSAPEDRSYPGWGALGWVDLGDREAGFSISTREPGEGQVNQQIRPTSARVGESASLETVREHCVASGETKAWNFAVLVHAGDWHAAADSYGNWFRQQFGTADHWPDWVKTSNGWLSDNTSLGDSWVKWPHLLDTFEKGRRLGIDHLQVWGQFGSSSCASFLWPSPKYGPIEEFAAVNKQIRDLGGHVGYYMLYDRENRYNIIDTETYEGYLPKTAYPKGVPMLTPEDIIRGAVVSDPEGKITAWPQNDREMAEFKANLARLLADKKMTTWANADTWPKHSMVEMHGKDPTWQQLLLTWTKLYAGPWHCDVAYQDVLGCGNSGRSFDLRRNEHGQIINSESALAKLLYEEGKKLEPNFVLSAEGKSELVTRWAVGMTSSQHYGWIYVAPHRYTHPDHILYLGAANGGYQQMGYNCELAYLYGARFELILTGDILNTRKIVTFRDNIKPFALRAWYRDTVGLTVDGAGIEATRHDRFRDGSQAMLVTVVNRNRTADGTLTVDTSALQGAFGAFWITDDWSVVKADEIPNARKAPGTFVTKIPAHHISALLLVNRVRTGEEVIGGVLPERVPGGWRSKVWLANLTGAARKVTALVEDPSKTQMQMGVTIPAYGVYTTVVQAAPQPNGADFGYVRLKVDNRQIAQNFLYPLVEDGSFEKKGTAIPDAADGARAIRMNPSKEFACTNTGLELQPGRRYLVSLQMRRTGTGGTQRALLRMRDANGQWQLRGFDFPRDAALNTWVKVSQEIDSIPDLTSADFYMYNYNNDATVDFDDLRITLLR